MALTTEQKAEMGPQAPLANLWTRHTDEATNAALLARQEAESGRTAAWGQGQLGLGAAQQQQHAAAVRGGALGARMGMYAGGAQASDVTQQAAVARAQEVSRARQQYIASQQAVGQQWLMHEQLTAASTAQGAAQEAEYEEWNRKRGEAQAAAQRKAAMDTAAMMATMAASDVRAKQDTHPASAAEQDAVIVALRHRVAALEAGLGGYEHGR